MKAGRELDSLIAKYVMDWDKAAVRTHRIDEEGGYPKDITVTFSGWSYYVGCTYKTILASEFRPSTDIAAAWTVVDKIKCNEGNDGTFKLQYFNEKWICYWDHEDFLSSFEDYPQSTSAPHAICLAALKAVGHELK